MCTSTRPGTDDSVTRISTIDFLHRNHCGRGLDPRTGGKCQAVVSGIALRRCGDGVVIDIESRGGDRAVHIAHDEKVVIDTARTADQRVGCKRGHCRAGAR